MSDEGKAVGMSSEAHAAVAVAPAARARSENTTLVFAVAVAVALGVACGIWVNSLLASSAAAARAARTRPASEAPPPADESKALQPSVEAADAPAAFEGPAAVVVEGRVLQPAATPPPTPAAREASPRPAPPREARESAASGGAVRRERPCALYASASSLTMRGGGAAFLVVGGPGQSPVTVSTPNWADVVVFSEGPAAGRQGWMRYTVKSVSKRPGLYTVRFATSCGSQTIHVTVK
ncbi:MAG TPA: hypothetical protein VN282_25950 [Pyrinomonadaceae bacterium]|nr:hypothetical protein [Pyrinomonadaceae bacterium]